MCGWEGWGGCIGSVRQQRLGVADLRNCNGDPENAKGKCWTCIVIGCGKGTLVKFGDKFEWLKDAD